MRTRLNSTEEWTPQRRVARSVARGGDAITDAWRLAGYENSAEGRVVEQSQNRLFKLPVYVLVRMPASYRKARNRRYRANLSLQEANLRANEVKCRNTRLQCKQGYLAVDIP